MEDIFNKLPYTDKDSEFTYFRMEDFYTFCKKNNWETDKTRTGNLIKQLSCFVGEVREELKGGTPRLVKIKTMKKIKISTTKEPYQQDNF